MSALGTHARNARNARNARYSRIAGAAALVLFAIKLAADSANGQAANILWFCFIGNLCLGLGLLTHRVLIARVGALFAIAGLPVWAISMTLVDGITSASALAHVGGAAIALWVIAAWRSPPWRAWPVALCGWLLALTLQTLCRWLTPPALNINLSHAIYPGWEPYFSGYFSYNLFVITATFVILAALSTIAAVLHRLTGEPAHSSQPLHNMQKREHA